MTATFTAHPYSTVAARNLIPNPAGHVDNWGWASATGAILQASVDRFRWQCTSSGLSRIRTEPRIPVSGVVSARAQVATGPGVSRQMFLSMIFVDANDASLSGSSGVRVNAIESGWTDVVLEDVTVPAGTAGVYVYLAADGAAVGDVFYGQDVLLAAAAAAPAYFDGDFPDSPGTEYEWTGPRNRSPSVKLTPDAADIITPALVLAPWTAGRESRAVLHAYMDDPATTRVTWRSAGPRAGELRLLFDEPFEAAAAADTFAGKTWFSYDGAGRNEQAVDRFCITPGQLVSWGHVDELTVVPDSGGVRRWQVTVPWTEISL